MMRITFGRAKRGPRDTVVEIRLDGEPADVSLRKLHRHDYWTSFSYTDRFIMCGYEKEFHASYMGETMEEAKRTFIQRFRKWEEQ